MTLERIRAELQREFISLLSARQHRFLRLLLTRATRLRFTAPAPASFRNGEEYLSDPVQLPCTIRAVFNSPSFRTIAPFYHNKNLVSVYQRGPVLTVQVDRQISSRLWDKLRLFNDGQKFLVGYVNALLPVVNRRLLDNRYLSGHILARTYSVYDALGIVVTHGGVNLRLAWPRGVVPFPTSAALAPQATDIYLRDYIDAIHAFMKNDFDDCVRRIITSVENFFAIKGWTATPHTFRNIVATNVVAPPHDQVIVDNLRFVYHVRNRIVHSGFRISTRGRDFCHKALDSLRYLIQWFCGSAEISKYATSLGRQTHILSHDVGSMFDLDYLKWFYGNPQPTLPPLTATSSYAQFEDNLFTALRLTEKDRLSILS
jgi:hypothetical protein